MGLKDCLWCIGGASKGVSGCRFSLYPMTDKFVDIILGGLEKTDTSKVWKQTDKLSTCVRGKSTHVFDVVKGLFVNNILVYSPTIFCTNFSILALLFLKKVNAFSCILINSLG